MTNRVLTEQEMKRHERIGELLPKLIATIRERGEIHQRELRGLFADEPSDEYREALDCLVDQRLLVRKPAESAGELVVGPGRHFPDNED